VSVLKGENFTKTSVFRGNCATKIAGESSIGKEETCNHARFLHESAAVGHNGSSIFRKEFAVRVAYQEQPRLDCTPIRDLELNLNCRDEIIPILRALQHIYADAALRDKLLDLVGQDVNLDSSADHGREGLDYWSILVLAAVRLGCNLDYDKLQNLAEEHRSLRCMIGLSDWEEKVNFDWRRIRDNVCLVKPETLVKINQLVVAAGHVLTPEAIESVRGDSFVVETNIHYPTESSLIGDGLRKVVTLAAKLAEQHGEPDWRQHKHLLKNVKKIVWKIGQAARAKGLGADRVKPGYTELLDLAESLTARTRRLLKTLDCRIEADAINWLGTGFGDLKRELQHYLLLTEKVCGTARRRVLLGETIANEEKIFSMFEPHTELIKRGKQPDPIQYGHKVLVIEDGAGFVCAYQVMADGVLDQDVVIPVMTELQKRMGAKIQRASFDRGFHTQDNQERLAKIVSHPCIPKKGQASGRNQHSEATVEFRQARQRHPGVESAIGALQVGNGQERCRDKSKLGYERYVGLGILGRNLHVLGKLLVAQDDANCQAAKSMRKKQAG
jgi:IS5 family transposase